VNDSKRAHLQVGVVQRQPDQLGATQAGEEQQGDDGSIPECDQRESAVLGRVEEEQALLHRQRLGRRARSSRQAHTAARITVRRAGLLEVVP
jgi:hypothetical protein